MPTQKYNNLNDAYRALTDIEVIDDESNHPVSVIKVAGLGKIKICMLSEWDYYKYFIPMQAAFLNYYTNMLARGDGEEKKLNIDKIKNKVNLFLNEINSSTTTEEIIEKARSLTFLFDDPQVRKFFFDKLKKMGVFPWYLTFRRYQKKMRPIDTMTIFCFLWAFNVDGLKKNAKFLLEKISQVTNTASPTASKLFNDLDSFKKVYWEAKKRQSKAS